MGWQLDETSNRDAGFGPVHWLGAIPTAAPTPRSECLFVLSPDVLRRPHMHTGLKSWELMLRNRTWDARRATVGPHLAAISGQRRSLRVSPAGVCSMARAGRGILPSWPCEFDSRHPLQWHNPLSTAVFTTSNRTRRRGIRSRQAGHIGPIMLYRFALVRKPFEVGLPPFSGDHQPDSRATHGPQSEPDGQS